jgi:hypothetical protein
VCRAINIRSLGPRFWTLALRSTLGNLRCSKISTGRVSAEEPGVSRTGAEVDPGLRRPEQKRRRVTWRKRCAIVEVPAVLHGFPSKPLGSIICIESYPKIHCSLSVCLAGLLQSSSGASKLVWRCTLHNGQRLACLSLPTQSLLTKPLC